MINQEVFEGTSHRCMDMAVKYRLPYGIPERIEVFLETIRGDGTSPQRAEEISRQALDKMQMFCYTTMTTGRGASEHLTELARFQRSAAAGAKVSGDLDGAKKLRQKAKRLDGKVKRLKRR